LFSILLVGGCAPQPVSPPPPPVAQTDPPPSIPQTQPDSAIIDLSMFQIFVPAGSISRNRDFWGYLAIAGGLDQSECDLLDRNGVRVGVGDVDDWSSLRTIIDKAGAQTLQGRVIGVGTKGHEIPVSDNLPGQTLFYFDQHGLSGHVYDACQNILVLSYEAAPQGSGAVRLQLCPLVRNQAERLDTTAVNTRHVWEYTHDQRLYDMGLSVDLAPRKFLVVGPSPQSGRSTSIGHQFFTQEATTQRREMIMIFVVNPRPQPIAVRSVRP